MLDLRTRIELGDVESRRTLCGNYTDTRNGATINIGGCRRKMAQATIARDDGMGLYGEYAWPTVLHLIESGTWTRKDDRT